MRKFSSQYSTNDWMNNAPRLLSKSATRPRLPPVNYQFKHSLEDVTSKASRWTLVEYRCMNHKARTSMTMSQMMMYSRLDECRSCSSAFSISNSSFMMSNRLFSTATRLPAVVQYYNVKISDEWMGTSDGGCSDPVRKNTNRLPDIVWCACRTLDTFPDTRQQTGHQREKSIEAEVQNYDRLIEFVIWTCSQKNSGVSRMSE